MKDKTVEKGAITTEIPEHESMITQKDLNSQEYEIEKP